MRYQLIVKFKVMRLIKRHGRGAVDGFVLRLTAIQDSLPYFLTTNFL